MSLVWFRDLAAQQGHPAERGGYRQHHAARQHEGASGRPIRRRFQELHVARIPQQQAEGLWFMALAALNGTNSRQTAAGCPISKYGNFPAPRLRFQLRREDDRALLQNHLWIGRARHALQQLRHPS